MQYYVVGYHLGRNSGGESGDPVTAALVALLIISPLILLSIVYLAGWRDEWFTSSENKKDEEK